MDVQIIKGILWGLGQMFCGLGIVGIVIALYKSSKHKTEVKKLEEQRRIMELELEEQNNKLKLLGLESKKYDKLIKAGQSGSIRRVSFMKKLVFAFLVCCVVMAFATSFASSLFYSSSVVGEVVLDTSEEVLGYFDIEIEKKHSGSLSVNLYDPEIIAVVNREIAKLGGEPRNRYDDRNPRNI
jgi:hypothetical protein